MNQIGAAQDKIFRRSLTPSWLIALVGGIGLLSFSLSLAAIILMHQHRADVRSLENASFNDILKMRESAWFGIRPRLAIQFSTLGAVISIVCVGIACFRRKFAFCVVAFIAVTTAAAAIGFIFLDTIPYS